jgi:hypothetical protein
MALDYIYQDITIPSNATQAYLQFAWGVDTWEDPAYGAFDFLYVLIRRPSDDAILAVLGTLSNLNADGWYFSGWYFTPRINLLSYKGQTIRLEFYSTNDYALPTSFLVDDVVVTVSAPLPPAATLVSPSGTTTDTAPTYTWNAAAGAMWYQLYVNDSTGNKIQRWYTAAEAGCLLDSSSCSVTPATEVIGSCQWWVQTYNSAGFGPWSAPLSFTVPPPVAATLISPIGTITDTTPTYTWDAVSDSTWYQLWVNDSTGNKINQWYAAADVGCADGMGTCTVTPTTEVRGAGQWWVRTYNSVGFGPWSSGMSFTAPTPGAPSAVIQVSPTGAIGDTTPTYTWNPVSNATWYCLYVNDSTGNKINQWYAAADAGCADGVGTCMVSPTTEVRGAGQWWVRTYNSGGLGAWSSGMSFTAPTPDAPSAATQVSPTGSITDTTPTYTWNAVSNSTWYQLWVNDSTGNKINQWYAAADAGCADGVGTCSVTPTTVLAAGAGQWWIRTYSSGGYGPWSLPGMSFTVSP